MEKDGDGLFVADEVEDVVEAMKRRAIFKSVIFKRFIFMSR
jgi:hypothetical protein